MGRSLSPSSTELSADVASSAESDEPRDVGAPYAPLSGLIRLHFEQSKALSASCRELLDVGRSPYVIGIAGPVAVGKTTIAKALATLISQWPEEPQVDIVATDSFLFPNAELESRGLSMRKGFPETYDIDALVAFLAELRSGAERVAAPVYSHVRYDVITGEEQLLIHPDVMILEGVNVLEVRSRPPVVSDFLDHSVYVDAAEPDVRRWYVARFCELREAARHDETAFFHRFADLDDAQARSVALSVWDSINGPNLRDHIAPTRTRANVILEKGPDHELRRVRVRST